ncbi:MAG: hypothetical protein HY814_02685 [Candidatus Riflebacteria bacterium]|nr:hypothetical protein [Candidatus Riflebacteria bacterium]
MNSEPTKTAQTEPGSGAPPRRVPWTAWTLMAVSILLETGGQTCLKLGARAVQPGLSELETISQAAGSLWSLAGYACIALQFPVWLGVLKRMELSIAFPLGSLSQITILLASVFVLREGATVSQVAGIGAILFGSLLIVGDGAP